MIELAFGKHPAKPEIANLLTGLDRVMPRVLGKCLANPWCGCLRFLLQHWLRPLTRRRERRAF